MRCQTQRILSRMRQPCAVPCDADLRLRSRARRRPGARPHRLPHRIRRVRCPSPPNPVHSLLLRSIRVLASGLGTHPTRKHKHILCNPSSRDETRHIPITFIINHQSSIHRPDESRKDLIRADFLSSCVLLCRVSAQFEHEMRRDKMTAC